MLGNKKNLQGILGTFTKAKNELKDFISTNSKHINKLDNDLNVAKGEQGVAANALEQINKIVGDK